MMKGVCGRVTSMDVGYIKWGDTMDYMRKEWRDNKPVPMDEAKLNKLLKDQAAAMRKAQDNGK